MTHQLGTATVALGVVLWFIGGLSGGFKTGGYLGSPTQLLGLLAVLGGGLWWACGG